MAFGNAPSPVLSLSGVLRGIKAYRTGERSAYGPGRDAANVQVLTDRGGFLDVYVDPDHLAEVRQLGEGSEVSWLVEVDVFTRTTERGSRWSRLSARYLEDLSAAPGSCAGLDFDRIAQQFDAEPATNGSHAS